MNTPATTLRAVPLFARLRDSDLLTLATMLRQRDYAKNRVVLFSYDPADALYVVIKGQVKVTLISEDGREVVLDLVSAGGFFGESALMDDEPFSKSAVAVEESQLLILHRDDFRRCITEMPGMAFGLLRAMCERLQQSDQKIANLMLLDVSGRVANVLLDWSAKQQSDVIRELPTHQVIAQMVGSTRESVSRTFGTLGAQHFIEVADGAVKLVDRGALESLSGQVLRRRPRPTPPGPGGTRRTPLSQPALNGPS